MAGKRQLVRMWFRMAWRGFVLSGWYGASITVVLNVFAASTLIWALLSGRTSEVAGVVAGVALIALTALVLFQAPYRGLLAAYIDLQREVDRAKEVHAAELSKLEGAVQPLRTHAENQRANPHQFIHTRPNRVERTEAETTFILDIFNGLIDDVRFVRVEGDFYNGDATLGSATLTRLSTVGKGEDASISLLLHRRIPDGIVAEFRGVLVAEIVGASRRIEPTVNGNPMRWSV